MHSGAGLAWTGVPLQSQRFLVGRIERNVSLLFTLQRKGRGVLAGLSHQSHCHSSFPGYRERKAESGRKHRVSRNTLSLPKASSQAEAGGISDATCLPSASRPHSPATHSLPFVFQLIHWSWRSEAKSSPPILPPPADLTGTITRHRWAL